MDVLKLSFKKQKMMRRVLLSLTPIIIFSVYNNGLKVLLLLLLVTIAGTGAEYFWEKHYKNKLPRPYLYLRLYTMTLPASIPIGLLLLVLFLV